MQSVFSNSETKLTYYQTASFQVVHKLHKEKTKLWTSQTVCLTKIYTFIT